MFNRLLVACALVLFPQLLAAQPHRHRAPPPPRPPARPLVLHSPPECRAHVRNPAKQRRCLGCVHRRGTFHRPGVGRCVMPPPPPPPRPEVLHSPPECRAHVRNPAKQRRCLGCVHRRGTFHRPGVGRCVMPPPPPPPPRPEVLHNPPECRAHVRNPAKQRRCLGCVHRRGTFHRPGVGRCVMPPPPPPPPHHARPEVLHNPPDCRAHVRNPAKQRRCLGCVHRRGTFHRPGVGRCVMPPPPHHARPEVLHNPPDCRAHVRNPAKRRRCLGCVHRRGTFHRPGVGRCVMPPPPPPPQPRLIRNKHDCKRLLGDKHLRKSCKRCVKHGGRFHPNGTCHGR